MTVFIDKIEISSTSIKLQYNIKDLKAIICHDPHKSTFEEDSSDRIGYRRVPKNVFIVVLVDSKGKRTRVRLKNYNQVSRLIDMLALYENIDILFHIRNDWKWNVNYEN